MKQYTRREVERILKANGYHAERWKGSHNVWSKPGCQSICLSGQKMRCVIVRRIFRENGIDVEI